MPEIKYSYYEEEPEEFYRESSDYTSGTSRYELDDTTMYYLNRDGVIHTM